MERVILFLGYTVPVFNGLVSALKGAIKIHYGREFAQYAGICIVVVYGWP
jgi:hypothetical protein